MNHVCRFVVVRQVDHLHEPTGRSFTVGGMVMTRFAGGLWAEDYATWEALGMLQQLGAIPVAAQATA